MRASAAVMLLCACSPVLAADLGTLFHSAAERERLDKLRRGEAVGGAVAPAPDPVITGYVKRSDGKSTVFIDKQPVPVRNPRLERRLDPRVVERYEPLPPLEPPAPAEPPVPSAAAKPLAGDPKAADTRAEGKARETATAAAKPPAARRRAEKDD